MRALRLALFMILAAISSAAMAADFAAAPAGRLHRPRFQIPRRRGDGGIEAALYDRRRADRPAGAGIARHQWLGRQHADAGLCRRIVRRRPAARRFEILHHHSRRHRPRQILKTLRRDEDRISELRLRRHGRGAISPGEGRPRHQASAACDRKFHGRHACLAVGRKISGHDGHCGADGLAADRDGGAQLDAAADDDRDHPQRPRLQ